MAAAKCTSWQIKSAPAWLREKGLPEALQVLVPNTCSFTSRRLTRQDTCEIAPPSKGGQSRLSGALCLRFLYPSPNRIALERFDDFISNLLNTLYRRDEF